MNVLVSSAERRENHRMIVNGYGLLCRASGCEGGEVRMRLRHWERAVG